MLLNNWFMLYKLAVHLESLRSTQEGRIAHSYDLKQLKHFSRALQTFRVHYNSFMRAKA